jgi:hypothetical protein
MRITTLSKTILIEAEELNALYFKCGDISITEKSMLFMEGGEDGSKNKSYHYTCEEPLRK